MTANPEGSGVSRDRLRSHSAHIEFFPNAKRSLYLDTEGHRTPTDAFDEDTFELQKDFLLGFLMPFLGELHTPLIHVENPKSQRKDLPEELRIYASADAVPEGVEVLCPQVPV